MTQKIIATVLAATIAITSIGATPAMAKPSDGVRILQGLAALYVISRVIEGTKDDRRPAVTPSRRQDHATWNQPRQRRHMRNMPNRCLKTFYTRRGETLAYGARCIKNKAPRLSLPQECKRRISTDRGRRMVYGPHCLRQHGFNVARR